MLKFARSRSSKRKCSENASSDLTKGCIGFEDQNGKKVAISTSTSLEAFRPINENSVNATQTVVVSSTKAGVTRGSNAAKKINNSNVGENVTQSTNTTRPVGKKRRGKLKRCRWRMAR